MRTITISELLRVAHGLRYENENECAEWMADVYQYALEQAASTSISDEVKKTILELQDKASDGLFFGGISYNLYMAAQNSAVGILKQLQSQVLT